MLLARQGRDEGKSTRARGSNPFIKFNRGNRGYKGYVVCMFWPVRQ